MAQSGTAKLRRKGIEALAFEVFELDLDEAAKAEMKRDPKAFFKTLLQSEADEPMNGLILDTMTTEVTGPVPQVYHCVSPPAYESKWITIVL